MSFLDIFNIKRFKERIAYLEYAINVETQEKTELQNKLNEIGYPDYEKAKSLAAELEHKNKELGNAIFYQNSKIEQIGEQINSKNEELYSLIAKIKSTEKKLNKTRELYKSVEYSINEFFNYDSELERIKLSEHENQDLEDISPSVILKLHCMDIKDLRRASNENNRLIEKVLRQYESRYTTKSNASLYRFMVLALQSELQNILIDLKYEKLDNAIEKLKTMTSKYQHIAAEGNKSIATTITKFIGEIEYLYINAIKIEYNYYVKKEQARQEQLEIREKMKQEAEERKALEIEKRKIEREESKYIENLNVLKEQAQASNGEELENLNKRILELEAQLSSVLIKKEEIVNLQNGKAGNVYIISNLGSFGENVFKIGMTRRLNPIDRVNELSNASVPFKFDVHSFIFSEDAVNLENKMHSILNDRRINKVNLRKEFFEISIDELENIVLDLDPTAEFNKTMLAEEFRQSQSSTENYTISDLSPYEEYDDEI